MTMLLTHLPFFQGFYESHYSSQFDLEVESAFENLQYSEDDASIYCKEDDIYDYDSTYKQVKKFNETVCKLFLDRFEDTHASHRDPSSDGDAVKLEFTYVGIDSPKYYNYETDKLEVRVEVAQLQEVYKTLWANAKELLKAVIKRNHTSSSGFISFYQNELCSRGWESPGHWEPDYVTASTVIEAWAVYVYWNSSNACHLWGDWNSQSKPGGDFPRGNTFTDEQLDGSLRAIEIDLLQSTLDDLEFYFEIPLLSENESAKLEA